MDNTTKILIAGAAGVGAYLLYKKAKSGKSKTTLDEKLKEAAEKGKSDSGIVQPKSSGSTYSKPSTGPTEYQKKVMALQELLKVTVDGDAGKQTNGTLDYWWSSDTTFPFNAEKSFRDGYTNLIKNGKGKVNSGNVDYYIAAMRDKVSPRHNASGQKSSYVPRITNPTETLSKDLLAKLARTGRWRLRLRNNYTAPEMVLNSQGGYTATNGKRSWYTGTSFFKGDFLPYPRTGTGNLLYVRGNYIYEIPPQNFELLNY